MFEISELVRKGLTEDAAVSAVVGAKVFPLLADQDSVLPFIVYRVRKDGEATKNASDYTVEVYSYESTYDKALVLHEKVMSALETVSDGTSTHHFTEGSAEPFYTEKREFYIQQIINIKN